MNRYVRWIEEQIAEHHPQRSTRKQSVGVLADACATLSGKGSQVFGMNMPGEVEDTAGLYARACEALGAWLPHLDPHEAQQLMPRIQKQGLDVPIAEAIEESDSSRLEDGCVQLYAEREHSLRRFGEVRDGLLFRKLPAVVDGVIVPWPTMVLGTLRLIRRPDTVLLVTDGLSNPWDPSLHDDLPGWTFGFELALEVPLAAFTDPSDRAIASSWAPLVLWAATDWVVAERFDLVERLEHSQCTTHGIPPVGGLKHWVADNGLMGGLLGLPFAGSVFGASVQHGPVINGRATSLLPIKLLTADEYEWAMGVHDSSRTVALAELFIQRGEGHLSWPDRMSALTRTRP